MSTLNIKQLHTEAGEAVSGFGWQATKLILTHAGITVAANLVLSLIGYLLDLAMAQTGGLSDIGTLTLLETVQQFLQTIVTIALPFWQMGYVFAAMQMARRQSADSVHLLTGFRYFGPVLRSLIVRWTAFGAAMLLGAQLGSYLFLLTPGGGEMLLATDSILAQLESAGTLDYVAFLENEAYIKAILPAVPFMLGGALILLVPVLYRLRMMDFVLMDAPRKGAFHAVWRSLCMTRKNILTILRLDLRFWWYYVLQMLTLVVCYGDVLLPLVGVELTIHKDVSAYLFYALALVGEFGLYVWQKNRVSATYVLLYEELRQPQPQIPKPAPAHVPWNV